MEVGFDVFSHLSRTAALLLGLCCDRPLVRVAAVDEPNHQVSLPVEAASTRPLVPKPRAEDSLVDHSGGAVVTTPE